MMFNSINNDLANSNIISNQSIYFVNIN